MATLRDRNGSGSGGARGVADQPSLDERGAVHDAPDGPENPEYPDHPEDPADTSDRDEDVEEEDDADDHSDGEGGDHEWQAEEEEEENPSHNIAASRRWRFLFRYFDDWFHSTQYHDHHGSSSVVDQRFGSFNVFLPYVVTDDHHQSLQLLRDATELIGYMLQLDKPRAWWFIKHIPKPWFRDFSPSNYDPAQLLPKMTFVLHQHYGHGDDEYTAVKQLHYMLLDCDRGSQDVSASAASPPDAQAFHDAKRKILEEEDPEKRLRGFQIPIEIKLRPQDPGEGFESDVERLRLYLVDVITLVRAVQQKNQERDSTYQYPFKLEGIQLIFRTLYAIETHKELHELFSLSVPITVTMRSPMHISWPHDWDSPDRGVNFFPMVAENPLLVVNSNDGNTDAHHEPVHTIAQSQIYASVEVFSGVAFSTRIRELRIEMDQTSDEKVRLVQVKWLAYTLRHARGLRCLEINRFQPSETELDAMQAILEAKNPAALLGEDPEEPGTDIAPRFVTLKPDGMLKTQEQIHYSPVQLIDREIPAEWTLAQINIPSGWAFPVVRVHEQTQQVEFVVPGHGICVALDGSVLAIQSVDPLGYPASSCEALTSLVVNTAAAGHTSPATIARFVRLISKSLREFSWIAARRQTEQQQEDVSDSLHGIIQACPLLESVRLESLRLDRMVAAECRQLRSLSLVNTRVPVSVLTQFVATLGDKTTPIAHTLERFTYYCPGHSLDQHATETALQTLETNRRLVSIVLGVQSTVATTSLERLDAQSGVPVLVERLALRDKLALLSVVRWYDAHTPTSALGRIDSSCVSLVFLFFSRVAPRRIQVLTE